jgi:serine/threonine protein kinase
MQGNFETFVGRTLGTCTLEQLIGHGGMGAVYLAKQQRPARRVAVKVLMPSMITRDNALYQNFLARFRREADVIANLEHINIIPIYEYGEQDGLAYLVMPYLSGGNLEDMLHKQGSFTPLATLTYLDQAASALDYAHEQGVVHRDLKPANFLIHADGRLMLTDFGIARILEESTPGTTLTGTDMVVGTPEYMAPEMASGALIDARTDIYELGIVLFKMLSGHVPFSGGTPISIAVQHLQDPLPSLHQQLPELPVAIDEVVRRATAKDRSMRYATAREMVQALSVAMGNIVHAQTPLTLAQFSFDSIDDTPHAPSLATSTVESTTALPTDPSSDPSIVLPSNSNTTGDTPDLSQLIMPDRPTQSRVRPHHFKWWIPLLAALILVVVAGTIFTTTSIGHNLLPFAQQPASHPTSASSTPATDPTATAISQLPASTQIYSSTLPGAVCDTSGGQWMPYNGVTYTCSNTQTQLHNTLQTQHLQGLFLSGLPSGSYPSNYIVAAQFQQPTSSDGDFGLYARNQPGDQRGAYTFMIQHNGIWAVYSYDNSTGAPQMLAQGPFTGDIHSSMQLAMVVNGSQISVYLNNQLLKTITDSTYATGTAGIAINQGATVDVDDFTLSTLSS